MTAVIAIIGAGNMGHSLIGGLIQNGHPRENILASDPSEEKCAEVAKKFSILTTNDNEEIAKRADVIIFAVKPQVFNEAAKPLAKIIQTKKPLVISIAAGLSIKQIAATFDKTTAIVRCMPNTPALIGCGASALFANENVSHQQRDTAESILRAVGIVVWLDQEKQLDTVTALSGSGPAYFFLVMQALEEAAQDEGLPQDIAHLLTVQTALGAARMALEIDKPLEELRHQVTSPGGTTEKALSVLFEHETHQVFKKALKSAKAHSEHLASLLEGIK